MRNSFFTPLSSMLRNLSKGLLVAAVMTLMAGEAMSQCTPVITPSGSTDLCSGQSVTLTSSAGASYLWSTGATTQSIIVNTKGTYVVTVDDGGGCIMASDPLEVTLYSNVPQRPSFVTGQNTVCPGETWTYSIATARRAVSYTWTLPVGATSGGLSVVTTADTTIDIDYDVNFTGNVALTVVANNGCGVSAVRVKNLYRRNPPKPTSITGPDFTCPGGSYDFWAPFDAGVDTWTWTIPAGAGISGQGNDTARITFPAGFLSGTITVVASNGCGSSGPKSVTKTAYAPNPNPISGPTSGLCGTSQVYTVNPVAGALSYTWTAPTGSSVISGQGTTSATIQFSGSLNNAFVKVASVNVCGSNGNRKLAVSGNVTIGTQPSDVEACNGAAAVLTIGVPGSGITYQWYFNGNPVVDGGPISGATTNTLTIDPATLADAGTYTCQVSNACSGPFVSDPADLSIVDPIAGAPGAISGIDVACENTLGQAFSIAPVAGASSYLWTGYQGAVIASGQGTVSVTVDFLPTVNSGYYIDVRAVNACGASDSTKKWVRRTVSVPTYLTFQDVACPGQNGVVYEINPVAGALSYNWSVTGGTIASGQGTESVLIDFDPGFTTGEVCVSATNQCVTTVDRCEPVISKPDVPGSIQGPGNNVCNSTQAYTINPVFGASGYTWSVGAGATIASGQGTNSVTIDFGPSYVTGDVSVTADNSCGTSNPKVKQVNAFPAKISSITGNAGPCANSSGNPYSVNPVTGATSYVWNVFAGATVASGQGTSSVTIDFGPTDGIISVAPVNACGAGYNTNLRIIFTCRIAATGQLVQVSAFPNPADATLFVKHNGEEGVTQIRITDLTGKVLMTNNNPVAGADGVYDLSVDQLAPGMYVIEIASGGQTYTDKFMKQ